MVSITEPEFSKQLSRYVFVVSGLNGSGAAVNRIRDLKHMNYLNTGVFAISRHCPDYYAAWQQAKRIVDAINAPADGEGI